MRIRRGRSRILRCVLVSAVTAAVLAPAAAHATSVGDMRAQAAQLQQQIDSNGNKIAALSEQYDSAHLQLDQANAAITQSEAQLKAAQDQTARTRHLVSLRAAELYRGASDPSLLPDTDVKTVNELSIRAKYGALATDRDENLIAKLEGAQADQRARRKVLDKRKSDAQAVVASIDAKRQQIQQANARQAQLLSQVKGQIAVLVRQEQQRRDAAARASFLAKLSQAQRSASFSTGGRTAGTSRSSGGGGSGAVDPNSVGRGLAGNIPAPSSKAQIAINYALAQVGKPYRYAGVGPDAYDCSGLTMMAWAQAGVYMPHASSGQYAMFPHVPFADIQPGDLIVWGVNGDQHVAMYLGNGMQVAATHTGDYVRVQPVYGGWWGVARPG